jgi:hypothetical protein
MIADIIETRPMINQYSETDCREFVLRYLRNFLKPTISSCRKLLKGAALMGLGLLSGWLFFATRATLGNGPVSALNRLAEIPGFKQLSTWPSE